MREILECFPHQMYSMVNEKGKVKFYHISRLIKFNDCVSEFLPKALLLKGGECEIGKQLKPWSDQIQDHLFTLFQTSSHHNGKVATSERRIIFENRDYFWKLIFFLLKS